MEGGVEDVFCCSLLDKQSVEKERMKRERKGEGGD